MALPHHTAHTYQNAYLHATNDVYVLQLCCILAVTYYAPQLIKLCTLICKPLRLRRFPLGSCLPALVLLYTQAELCKPLRAQTRATTPLTAAHGAAVGDGKLCGLPAGTCEL
jgi:hypothetical protein